MKSRLTPVTFEHKRIKGLINDTYSIDRRRVIVNTKEPIPVYGRIKLFVMKLSGKKWYVVGNPDPMKYSDNYILKKSADRFRKGCNIPLSVYYSRFIYR